MNDVRMQATEAASVRTPMHPEEEVKCLTTR